jgi:hypothetical protein
MLDALNRAKRYRGQAAGCRGLAAIGLSFESGTTLLGRALRHARQVEESATLPDALGDQ